MASQSSNPGEGARKTSPCSARPESSQCIITTPAWTASVSRAGQAMADFRALRGRTPFCVPGHRYGRTGLPSICQGLRDPPDRHPGWTWMRSMRRGNIATIRIVRDPALTRQASNRLAAKCWIAETPHGLHVANFRKGRQQV